MVICGHTLVVGTCSLAFNILEFVLRDHRLEFLLSLNIHSATLLLLGVHRVKS